MPSVLTHYCFNKEIFDNGMQFLKGNEDIYNVGAQGPDPFFFYGIIPLTGKKRGALIRKYGSKLHKKDPSEMFEFMFEYASEKKNKDILYSYILGAGMHYILDRKIHPYVYYKTGFSDDRKLKKKYFANHTLFETNLDVLLINNKYKEYKIKPIDSIRCDEEKIEEVSEMYYDVSKKVFKEEFIDDDTFEDSYKHMQMIEKLLYSKRGIKKLFANLFVKNTPLNTMMHPLVVKDDEKIDYLNLRKDKWRDPQTEEVLDKSFYELIEEAKEEAKDWIRLVNESYLGKKVDIKDFTKGFIYDGYKEGRKMKVFKNVYKKGEESK